MFTWRSVGRGVQKELAAQEAVKKALAVLDAYLQTHTFLVGNAVTLADIVMYANLHYGFTLVCPRPGEMPGCCPSSFASWGLATIPARFCQRSGLVGAATQTGRTPRHLCGLNRSAPGECFQARARRPRVTSSREAETGVLHRVRHLRH